MPPRPDEKMYHVELSRDMLQGATAAFVPGAPERTDAIAARLTSPVLLADHRGLRAWRGLLDGVPVLVQTSGMGGPSLEIVMNELLHLGIRTFVRIGTTGSIAPDVPVGSLIVSEAAVRIDGTSDHYAPPSFPAAADCALTLDLFEAAREVAKPQGRRAVAGITASSASFYAGQERYDSGVGHVPAHFRGTLEEWRALGVLNYEMEAATLFVLARVARARAGCVCAAVAHRTASEKVDTAQLDAAVEAAISAGVEGLRRFLRRPAAN